MANKKYEETNIQAIADAIREKTGTETTYKVSEMSSGVNEVYEAGKKSQYDEFWDEFQKETAVQKDGYSYAFMRRRWTDENFRPKYDLTGKNFYFAFYGTGIKNIPACLERQGVKLDTSQATSVGSIFMTSQCNVTPPLDTRNVPVQLDNLYYACWSLTTVGTIILKEDGSQTFNSTCFYDTPSLKNITFEGVIGKSISFSYSPLTVESMKSVITHLKDYKGTDEEYTYKVTFSSACLTALEAEGATSPNGNTWTDYMLDLGWNYS